jgi:uncharacterized protein YqfA (UPF0365 family)
MSTNIPVIAVVTVLFVLVLMVFILSMLRTWVRAMMSGVPIQVSQIVSLRFHGNPPSLLVDAYIILFKEGIKTSLDEVESLFVQNRGQIARPEELVRLVKEYKAKK